MLGAKRKCDWMEEERQNHVDGENGTCVWKLGTAAQRGGSQSAYQLTITDVFLLHSEALLGSTCKANGSWSAFLLIYQYHSSKPRFFRNVVPTPDAVPSNLITLSTRFLTTTKYYRTQ